MVLRNATYFQEEEKNNWNLILQALDRAGYNGPFLYEIRGNEIKEFRELKDCYEKLYSEYSKNININYTY